MDEKNTMDNKLLREKIRIVWTIILLATLIIFLATGCASKRVVKKDIVTKEKEKTEQTSTSKENSVVKKDVTTISNEDVKEADKVTQINEKFDDTGTLKEKTTTTWEKDKNVSKGTKTSDRTVQENATETKDKVTTEKTGKTEDNSITDEEIDGTKGVREVKFLIGKIAVAVALLLLAVFYWRNKKLIDGIFTKIVKK
ncbi:hypothetical protein [Petrimonas sulfuriphila]|uniref:hypothetical protein n=1 Tax=Petrimonas sulfuriphila TaxID=285070 RepID=UPI003EBBCDB3